jgi:NAD(P)-dependent dehydrogenase (short-subunit alcohol dehydrogenase family)
VINMDRVADKVVIVTGGGSGIGRATSFLLAKEGASVAVADVDDVNGQATVDQIIKEGGQAEFWHVDSSKETEVEKFVKSVAEFFGKIDGLVNNAGISGIFKPSTEYTGFARPHEYTEEEWDAVQNVNVKGVFFFTKHTIPHLLKNSHGSIVNISSIAGLIGQGGNPPYYASKGAVRLMTKGDALSYIKDNIRVNSVHPGFVWTPIFNSLTDKGITKEMLTQWLPSHCMQRAADPLEIAYGVLFLISDESSFMTGSELIIDGGYTAG